MGLALGKNWKFYTIVAKGLKLIVRTCWGLNPTFAEVTGEKLVGENLFATPILNRVKRYTRGKCITRSADNDQNELADKLSNIKRGITAVEKSIF